MNKQEFVIILTGLSELFNKPISEFILDVYYETLKDYDIEQIKLAVYKCLKNYKYASIPKPAEILEYLEGTINDKALQAWLQAKEAVRKGGYYSSIIFKDPIIPNCINELGGWQWFCSLDIKELPFVEKRFLDLYRLFEKREICENVKLMGFIESFNQNKGFLDKIPEPIQIGFDADQMHSKCIDERRTDENTGR